MVMNRFQWLYAANAAAVCLLLSSSPTQAQGDTPVDSSIEITPNKLSIIDDGGNKTSVDIGGLPFEKQREKQRDKIRKVDKKNSSQKRKLITFKSTDSTVTLSKIDVVLTDNNLVNKFDLSGGGITINGNGCDITIVGSCRQVDINGNRNRVQVEAVGTVHFYGKHNSVIWKDGLGGSPPFVEMIGSGNYSGKAN